MRLKKLEIRGFKTFAEPTEVEFTPGITAVVGPNGSGKSNISDAILWVMGESNVRNLRATRTEDVIFSGSANRRPVGLAEVSLTIDNSTGKLPVGFDEVTVTRRAYRSGESEYFINKVGCRLKDIYEMFLDSGAGRGAYSMVSQGEIDRLLMGKAEDRRELLEEAAGVKKYRHRRLEAYRKLEHTHTNLSRVDDLMRELFAQMEPLAEQAETARRYRELTERLKEIEVGLLVSRVQRLNADILAWKETEKSSVERLSEMEAEISGLTFQEQQASRSLGESREHLEASHTVFSEAQARVERLRSDLAVAEARKQSTEEGKARIAEDIESITSRLAELKEQAEAARLELEGVREQRQELEEEAATLSELVESLAGESAERQAVLAEQEAGARGLAEDKAAQKSRMEGCIARRQELLAEVSTASERLEDLALRRQQRSAEAEQAQAGVEGSRQDVLKASELLEGLRTHHDDESDNLQSASALLEDVSRLLLERSSRLKMLREMQDAREGYFAGVRAVLEASAKGQLPPDYAVVADILNAPGNLEEAIETALGSALQDIATPGYEQARRAIDYLKERSLGRATFLPMDRLDRPGVFGSARLGSVTGILGSAYELISFEPRYEPVARLLLSRVLVAEDLDSAAEAARKLRGWSKIVTPEGELVLPSGAISGGSRVKKGAGLMERKREINELGAEIVRLTDEQQAARAAADGLKESLARLSADISRAQSEVEDAKVSMATAEGRLEAANRSAAELDDVEAEARARYSANQRLIEDLLAEADALEKMLTNSDAAGDALEQLVARHQAELAELIARREEAASRLSGCSSRLSALEERERALNRMLAAAQEDLQRSGRALNDRRAELEQIDSSGEETSESLESLAAQTRDAAAKFEESRAALMAAQSVEEERRQAHERVAGQVREERESREVLSQELHEIQITLARSDSELVQALERLLSDYEITKTDALTWPEPLLVKHGTATEVLRLRREIRSMGEVNTGAVAEYDRVRERHEFLATQRADLREAEESLLEAIREIDDSTRELFMTTFGQVAGHFEDIFKRLFGGGEARLQLTKPDDLLETGIEVIVQPPGKTLQNMDLLSGGEKALTAQALLFALMRVKPSPFCVLDEVDAPLDDANVGRFAELVKLYAEESQFIIITHNRATMEAADVLYGVTMSEPGISKLVSARLTDE